MLDFDEICKKANDEISRRDFGHVDCAIDLPDYIAFSCSEKGYGIPLVYFPKNGGQHFLSFPFRFNLDDPNRNILDYKTIEIPEKYKH